VPRAPGAPGAERPDRGGAEGPGPPTAGRPPPAGRRENAHRWRAEVTPRPGEGGRRGARSQERTTDVALQPIGRSCPFT
jgi:hypothetical protein